MLNLQAKLKTEGSSFNHTNTFTQTFSTSVKRKMPLKKKRKYTLKTIFKPIFTVFGCGCSIPPPSQSHYILGPPVSPTVLRSPCPKIDESVAVAKESINPFEDYKKSMNQMIKERYIETEDDLKELLRCFLDINPPLHHNLIVRAFVDVCSNLRPPYDRRGNSLGRLLRLYYANPLGENNDDDDESHQTSSFKMIRN